MHTEMPVREDRTGAPAVSRAIRSAFTEEQFIDLKTRLDQMSELELTKFRAAPENQVMLRQFNAYAIRQVLPYLSALIVLLLVSLTAGVTLSR